jgi:hypothetical protein
MNNKKSFKSVTSSFFLVLTVICTPMMLRAEVNTVDKQAADWSIGDKTEQAFKKAHADFLKKESKAAAEEIRKAAGLVKQEEERAAIDAKKDLSAAYQELEKLASDVEKGRVATVKELDRVFVRTQFALARNYYLTASEAWISNETAKAGHNLKSAAGGLERGLAWVGQKVETGTQRAIRDAREAGDKLITGAGWVKDEVDKGMADLGREINKFSRKQSTEHS